MSKNNYDDCQANHREGVCPVCGSSNVEYGAFEVDDNGGSYPVTCSACGAAFHEAYSFAFAGHYAIEPAEEPASLKTYKVPVSYTVNGYLYLEAKNEKDAYDKALTDDYMLSDVQDEGYVEETWEVYKEGIVEY